MTLRAGNFRLLAQPSFQVPCIGRYTVSGNTVSIDQKPPNCQGRTTAQWSLQNGRLRLHVGRATSPGDAQLFGTKPWKKIG